MTNKHALDALELPTCTSFCQNSDNSNGICRACLERENTAHGILQNIAKRMTADSCVDYPQWLFTLVEAGIKAALTRQPEPVNEQLVLGKNAAYWNMAYIESEDRLHRQRIINAQLLEALKKLLDWHDAKPFEDQDIDLMELAQSAIAAAEKTGV